MRIGEVAAKAGVRTQTIRFYERRGLLPEPRRGANGYRDYDPSVVALLGFIRSGQAAGLTLAEVASVVGLRREGAVPCAHVDVLLRSKVSAVRALRRELATLEGELKLLLSRSERLDPADCTESDVCHILSWDDGTDSSASATQGLLHE